MDERIALVGVEVAPPRGDVLRVGLREQRGEIGPRLQQLGEVVGREPGEIGEQLRGGKARDRERGPGRGVEIRLARRRADRVGRVR